MADIVVCCDGTWNTPDDMDGGLPSPTNVCKIYNALDVAEQPDRELIYYHSGVGTEGGLLNKVSGGGLGVGLTRNVKSAYKWLAVNYREGDRIWIFGFSRGAFTARCIAGMVTRYGLLNLRDRDIPAKTAWERVDAVYEKYRAGDKTHLPAVAYCNNNGVTQVHFLGVWDTVGSLGIPDDVAFLNLLDNPGHYEFHDTDLNDDVLNARHALALDEMRQSFIPTLWTNIEGRPHVKQVWFSGVHSDVGGGYSQTGLSDSALKWMMDEARELGLRFHDVEAQLRCNPLGFLHNSCNGVFKMLPTRPRNVPAISDGSVARGDVHQSVLDRVRGCVLTQSKYRRHRQVTSAEPVITDVFAAKHWNHTGIFLREGTEYHFKATGEWMDKDIASTADGTNDGKFVPSEIFHLAGKAVGWTEGIYQQLFDARKAEFWGSLRYGNTDWFALVGVIANGAGTDDDWNQEQFIIGSERDFRPKKSGYLYCFANDAWLAYENNRGSVRLTVSVD